MKFEEVSALLTPESLPYSSGVERLPDGVLRTACHRPRAYHLRALSAHSYRGRVASTGRACEPVVSRVPTHPTAR